MLMGLPLGRTSAGERGWKKTGSPSGLCSIGKITVSSLTLGQWVL